MGFFSNLFAKKSCDLCGGEIGLLGNRKLEDGNCCKNCAGKLSPWFDERRHSTVDQIKAQLDYRAENEAAIASFKPIKILGENYKMFVEYDGPNPSRFLVTRFDLMTEGNPDIVPFVNVSGCEVDIRDTRTEEKRRNDAGEYVSYNPPRYKFRYDFYIKLTIRDIPWFDDMRFKVNNRTVEIISELDTRVGRNSIDPTYNPEYREYAAMCDEIAAIVAAGQNPQSGPALPPELIELDRQNKFWDQLNKETDPQKRYVLLLAEYSRIKENPTDAEYRKRIEDLTKAHLSVSSPETMAAAAAHAMEEQQKKLMEEAGITKKDLEVKNESPTVGKPGVCPDCGATDQTGKFCEFCGAEIGG